MKSRLRKNKRATTVKLVLTTNFPPFAYKLNEEGEKVLKPVWAKKANKFSKVVATYNKLLIESTEGYNIPTTYTGVMKPIGQGDYSHEVAYRNKSRRLANEARH